MKLNAVLVKSLLIAASVGMATLVADAKPSKPAPVAPKADEAAAEEAEPTIPGVAIQRKNGGFLGLEIENNVLKLSFYDAKKKPVNADVSRAMARWNAKYKVGDERRVLNPAGDGKTLVSTPLRPPYNFKLFLTLLSEQDEAVENYTVDIRQ